MRDEYILIKFGQKANPSKTICYDGFSFSIENDVICHNDNSRIGSDFVGETARYERAYESCKLAYSIGYFDKIEDNTF